MQILAQGAEAILYLDTFDSQKVLVKERIRKKYRIPQIDEKLRKERTKKEVKLMRDSRTFGVKTPQIVNLDEATYRIVMEFIDGEKIKDVFSRTAEEETRMLAFQIGGSIGKLHKNHIIHGDLTTSNMILKNGTDDVYFIDFGLGRYSKRVEDKGVDLRLLHGAISSAHYKILKLCWGSILEGYRKEYKNAEEVIKKIEEIEGRTRYAERAETPKRKDKDGDL